MWLYIAGLSLAAGGICWWKRRTVSHWVEKYEWMIRLAERLPNLEIFIRDRDKAEKLLRFDEHAYAVTVMIPDDDKRFEKPKAALLELLGTFRVKFEEYVDRNWEIARRRDLLPKGKNFDKSRGHLNAAVTRNDEAEDGILTKMRVIVDQATATLDRADMEDQLAPLTQIDAMHTQFLRLLGDIAPDAQNRFGEAKIRQLHQGTRQAQEQESEWQAKG